jgi:hypothetical protein
MTPEEIRVKLGLQLFSDFAREMLEKREQECLRRSGYWKRVVEHVERHLQSRRTRRWKDAEYTCRKCEKDPRVKRHARRCPKRGYCHIGQKQRIAAQEEFERQGAYRQTGRTTDRLIQVLSLFLQGKSIVHISHTRRFADYCMRQVQVWIKRLCLDQECIFMRFAIHRGEATILFETVNGRAEGRLRGSNYDELMYDHFAWGVA